ncbi:hypothetical protein AAZX31_19G085600 [Glycine max]
MTKLQLPPNSIVAPPLSRRTHRCQGIKVRAIG